MSFHKQIEQQLAQEFSPKEAAKAQPIVINYEEAVFHGRRLHDQEMHRLLAIAGKTVSAWVKGLLKVSYRQNTDNLPNYLRQDIGLSPNSGSAGRGYM